MSNVLWSVWYVHEAHQISIRMYGDLLIPNLIIWILYSIVSLKSLLWSRGDDQTWDVIYFVEKDSVVSHVFRDNLCIASHLQIYLYNILSTYALVMPSLKWIPRQYMFYLNGLNLYMLMMILNCRGRFLLSVSFLKKRHT